MKIGLCQTALFFATFGVMGLANTDNNSVFAEETPGGTADEMFYNNWPQLYKRNSEGEIIFPNSGATRDGGLGQSYNRPVYQNNKENADDYGSTVPGANPLFGTYLNTLTMNGDPATGAVFSLLPAVNAAGDNASSLKWPYPLLRLSYVSNGVTLTRLSKDKITEFLTNQNNATRDYYKNGQLNLTFNYSVKIPITRSMSQFVDHDRQSMRDNGMAFNLFFKLPDGYKNGKGTSNVRNAMNLSDSYFKLLILDSSFSNTGIYNFDNYQFNFSKADKVFTAVDDHFLKFSMTNANYPGFSEGLNQFFKLNTAFLQTAAV